MSWRGKFVLLLVVIAAILYVLISPLPELAATSTLNFPVLPLIVVVLLQKLMESFFFSMVRMTPVSVEVALSSRNCVLLC